MNDQEGIMTKWITILGTCFVLFSGLTVSAETPKSMAAIGDSISRGTSSSLLMIRNKRPWVMSNFAFRAFMTFVLGKTRAMDFERNSWSTGRGRSVSSHAKRLQELLPQGQKLIVKNFALSGTETEGLFRQLHLLKRWSRKKLKQNFPDYLTLMIGANDICNYPFKHMILSRHYALRVRTALREVLETSARTKILISDIPNITALPKLLRNQRIFKRRTCGDLWKLGICKAVTAAKSDAALKAVDTRIRQYNNSLAQMVDDFQGEFGDRIRMSKSVYSYEFDRREMAIDCFHPSAAGQDKIAKMTWASTWWAKEN